MRTIRMRPALIFKGSAGTEIKRYFAGPLLPRFLLRDKRLPFVPNIRGLHLQAVHSHDVGEAFRLALVGDARGAFNLAADPVLTMPRIAELLEARLVPLPAGFVRAAAAVSYALGLQPSEAGWFDLAMQAPLMSSARARRELGWHPRHSSTRALLELVEGMGRREGLSTPPLSPEKSSATA